jgi:photosystem II stability/assembly factor-like uncharacterized protein
MARFSSCFFAFVLILFSFSCKKDILHFQKVQKLNGNTPNKLNHIRFIGGDICIAAGGIQFEQSDVTRSVDGGFNWSASSYADAPKEMFGMGVSPNGDIYLSGVDGDVLRSRDSGNTWKFHHIDNWLVYKGGSFPTPDTGIFVSTVLQRQCTITRIDSNFRIIDEQTFLFGINDIYMVDQNTGYIIGYGTVMKTTDRGNSWHFQEVKNDNFMAMDIHGNEIWMCGYNGSIYHTADGGASWSTLRNGNDITLRRYRMLSIVFSDQLHGWASCDDGRVIYSDDGGKHWAEYDRFCTTALRSIVICPNGDLLTVGDNGNVFRITPL